MAFDFSKVKNLTIPEGKVKSLVVGGKTVWQAKTQAEQLTAPTISLDGDTLTMTATDDRTQEFVIFVDGVEMATVEVPKEETYTVSGTWYFNEPTSRPISRLTQSVKFSSNGIMYSYIEVSDDKTSGSPIWYDSVVVYSYGGIEPEPIQGWQDEAYRTITFDGIQTVSKEFYDWLVANATRQTISFTISIADGSGEVRDPQTLTVQSGITWREWVETTDYTHLDTKPTIVDNTIMINEGDLYRLKDMPSYSSGNYISPDEVIQPNTVYYFVTYLK